MKLGLNLSFATKRWMEPEILAKMCKEDFGINNVQFTWDLIDPWWPSDKRDKMALEYKNTFDKYKVNIDSSFGGLAAYTYAHLLAPTETQREIGFKFFKRAIDLTVSMSVDVLGTPIGGMSYSDARDKKRRDELYSIAIDYIIKLSEYAKEKGLKEIQIESTPLDTEFPHNPEVSLKFMKNLENKTAIPVKLLIDWGHALYKPLLKEEADMEFWMKKCERYIGAVHLQQTDGMSDSHWGFTRDGIVTLDLIKSVSENTELKNLTQYLELIYPFEKNDDEVYQDVKKSIDILSTIFIK